MKETATKTVIAAIGAGFAAYFEVLLVPIIVAVVVMLCDYLSGMAAAWTRSELSSRTGIVGIVKKVAYFLVIAVGIVVDWVVQAAADRVGIDAGNFCYFALLVTLWLIVNECISILENVEEIGAPVPAFLMSVIKKLKSSTEAKGDEVSK